ncbi:hypothetical protein DKC09_01895 (plasmid) [Klebsiella quasipneumoniae]|uniref:Uncharacterized protein n=1 Tax=Klebsiella quasipneumoniae TaxID=1463165 RepID=A0AAI8IRA0_9ENTR|nr:hypothetical protein DKC11_03020 [Klebsiella quasipneumoniae]AWL60794.1 hypothetical protein DKC00_03180 [Klebsiella quasipneumoniae]AWL71950.1 hypothetical protein DKC09_01895 [Klebsiella quasipneumoniae]EBF7093815.1 hypothetical protein [Salmonella enterica subsp. enterica serovar Liverpool]
MICGIIATLPVTSGVDKYIRVLSERNVALALFYERYHYKRYRYSRGISHNLYPARFIHIYNQ